MTGDDVPQGDMPNFLRPGRQDAVPLSDAALAALLAGTDPPAERTPGLQPVADVLAALKAGPASDELAGEAMALAEFRRGAGVSASPRRSRDRRPRLLPARLSTKAAAAAAAVAVALGGLASAAFAGMLPAPIQRLAHDTIGAPAAPSGSPTGEHLINGGTSASPKATGGTAPAVCAAYTRAKLHGTATQRAIAFHNLIKAAGGAGKIAALCRAEPGPGKTGSRSSHHTGKGTPPGQRGKGTPPGQHKKTPPGQQKKTPPGQRHKGTPPGHQPGHHKPHGKGRRHSAQPEVKSSAHRPGMPGAPSTPHATERFSPHARS